MGRTVAPSISGRPERFFGVFTSSRTKVRGIELRRSDAAPFLRRAQEEMLGVLFGAKDPDEYLALAPRVLEVLEGYLTGLREGRVNVRERRIVLDPGTTKNSQGRVVFVPEGLSRVLREQKDARDQEHPDCPWVFHHEGKPICYYRRAREAACRRVGLEGRLFS